MSVKRYRVVGNPQARERRRKRHRNRRLGTILWIAAAVIVATFAAFAIVSFAGWF